MTLTFEVSLKWLITVTADDPSSTDIIQTQSSHLSRMQSRVSHLRSEWSCERDCHWVRVSTFTGAAVFQLCCLRGAGGVHSLSFLCLRPAAATEAPISVTY